MGSRITTLIVEALGSETSEEALMSAVEARLNLQLGSNLFTEYLRDDKDGHSVPYGPYW